MNFITEQFSGQDADNLRELILKIVKPGIRAIEIGSYTGASALSMLPVIKENNGTLHCFDTFKGSPGLEGLLQYDTQNIYHAFIANIIEAGFKDCVTVCVGPIEKFMPDLKDATADFVFVDSDHRYTQALQHMKFAESLCKPGGIVCGHDFEAFAHQFHPGSLQAYCEQDMCGAYHCGVIKAACELFPKVQKLGNFWWNVKE